jgi:hypothetical protein
MGDYAAFCVNQSKLLPRVEVSIIRYSLFVVRCSLFVIWLKYLYCRVGKGLPSYMVGWVKLFAHPTPGGLRFMERKCKCAIVKLSTGVRHPARSSLYLKVIEKVIESHKPLMDRLDASPVTRVGNLFD